MAFGFSTKSYKYDNTQLYLGLGYKLLVSKTLYLKGDIIYNQYYSFRQKYIASSPVSDQINYKSIGIGRTLNFMIGFKRNISQKISLEIDAVLPIYNNWNNDEISIKYDLPVGKIN